MMRRRRHIVRNAFAIGVFLVSVLVLASCGEDAKKVAGGGEERTVLYWKSPMDPSFISQQPGKDVMGMDLVPVYEGDKGADLTTIAVSGATLQRMGVRMETVERYPLHRSIRSVATIDYDERTLTVVNMKFDGWIEKLYVNETGQYVRQGDPLFDIYSPELVASAEEYIQAVRGQDGVPHMEHLLRSARRRLELLDLSKEEIDRIRDTGLAPRLLTIYAPASGYVIHKSAFQGTFVKTGSLLFRIADLSTVWVYVDIYEFELPWLPDVETAKMQLTYVPGITYEGSIDYVYPFLNTVSRTVKVRLAFPNPDLKLKPGMFATVELVSVSPDSVLIVPSAAVIHTGRRNVVFAALGNGRFEPRDVRLGRQGDGGDYEVLEGLAQGERVVTSGQFLLDSESRLKEAVAKMLGTTVSTDAEGAISEEPDVPHDSMSGREEHDADRSDHEGGH